MPDMELFIAVANNNKQRCKELIGKVDINQEDGYGRTPIFDAILFNSLDILELLIKNGANINKRDINGETPLFRAAGWNHPGPTEVLLKYGANTNIPNKNGETPLHFAAKYLHIKSIKILLKYGADPNVLTYTGATPLLLIITSAMDPKDNLVSDNDKTRLKMIKVIKILLNHGAKINKVDVSGISPITAAISKRYGDIVDLLLNEMEQRNDYFTKGKMLLMLAFEKDENSIIHRDLLGRDMFLTIMGNFVDAFSF